MEKMTSEQRFGDESVNHVDLGGKSFLGGGKKEKGPEVEAPHAVETERRPISIKQS